MTTLTFRDFTFRAQHNMPSKHGAAAHPHWHTYLVRFWFTGSPDQDQLSAGIERRFVELHGCSLNKHLQPDNSDEALAVWMMEQVSGYCNFDCVKVTVINDGQRGAEVSK